MTDDLLEADDLTSAERHQRRLERISTTLDPRIHGLIERWRTRGGTIPAKMPEPAAFPARRPSAAEVRLSWYIPRRHGPREGRPDGDTLENFRPITDSQRAALDATVQWVESVKRGEGGALALVGGVGTGKSHLLYAAIRELNISGIHAAAYGWFDLAEIRRDAKLGDDRARVKWGRLLAANAFALDEIRPSSGSGFDTQELSNLMIRAYRECQGVIVTSNHVGERLAEIVSHAASSRLTQVVVMGPDMRELRNRRRYLGAA